VVVPPPTVDLIRRPMSGVVLHRPDACERQGNGESCWNRVGFFWFETPACYQCSHALSSFCRTQSGGGNRKA
jgi:hypothetical protein